MAEKQKAYGRTLFDLIADHPRLTFFTFLSLLLIAVALIIFKVPFQVGNVTVGEQTKLVHDTLVQVRTDTQYVFKNVEKASQPMVRAPKLPEKKVAVKKADTAIVVQGVPANINTGTNNGIIGNNGVINQAPPPTIKLVKIEYQDQKVQENITKLNRDLPGYENVECYKTFLRFNYHSDSKKDNMDFRVNVKDILHVDMVKTEDLFFDTVTWETNKKVKGYRFLNPTNGIYEMTFYTLTPVNDPLSVVHVAVNNVEIPVKLM